MSGILLVALYSDAIPSSPIRIQNRRGVRLHRERARRAANQTLALSVRLVDIVYTPIRGVGEGFEGERREKI